jgi:hypothetical protein
VRVLNRDVDLAVLDPLMIVAREAARVLAVWVEAGAAEQVLVGG